MHVTPLISSEPVWAVSPAALNSLVAREDLSPARVEAAWNSGELVPTLPRLRSAGDGVFVVEVRGLLLRKRSAWACAAGATTVEDLERVVDSAAADPGCTALIFRIDSSGGILSPMSELAMRIDGMARRGKPAIASIRRAFGPALTLASLCQAIGVDQDGALGFLAAHWVARPWAEPPAGEGFQVDIDPDPLLSPDLSPMLDALTRTYHEDLAERRRVPVASLAELTGRVNAERAADLRVADIVCGLEGVCERTKVGIQVARSMPAPEGTR
jgi:hypothetical protein